MMKNWFNPNPRPQAITTVVSSLDLERSTWGTYRELEQLREETRYASQSNLTRTAAGPFDPDKPWLDQVLSSCSLDSHDSGSDKK